jgi:CDP-paratose 2-epimerase
MSIAIVTGSAGLIGAEAVRFLTEKGMDVVGIDNDMRQYFFGEGASTRWSWERLCREIPSYRHESVDSATRRRSTPSSSATAGRSRR